MSNKLKLFVTFNADPPKKGTRRIRLEDGSILLPGHGHYLDKRIALDYVTSLDQVSQISNPVISFNALHQLIDKFGGHQALEALLKHLTNRCNFMTVHPRSHGVLAVLREIPCHACHFKLMQEAFKCPHWKHIEFVLSRPELLAGGRAWTLDFQRYIDRSDKPIHRYTIISDGETIKLNGRAVPQPESIDKYDVEHFLYDFFTGSEWYLTPLLACQLYEYHGQNHDPADDNSHSFAPRDDVTIPQGMKDNIFHHIDGWTYCEDDFVMHYIKEKNAYWLPRLMDHARWKLCFNTYRKALESHYAMQKTVHSINLYGPLWLSEELCNQPCYLYRTGMLHIPGWEKLKIDPLLRAGLWVLDPHAPPSFIMHDLPFDHPWLRELCYHRGIFRMIDKKPTYKYRLADTDVKAAIQLVIDWMTEGPDHVFFYDTLRQELPTMLDTSGGFIPETCGKPNPPLLLGSLVLWRKINRQHPDLVAQARQRHHKPGVVTIIPGPALSTSLFHFSYINHHWPSEHNILQTKAQLLVHLLQEELESPCEARSFITTAIKDKEFREIVLQLL